MDIIFELVDGLWFIDIIFSYEVLINYWDGKYLEFLGFSFWYFKKDCEIYCRFVGELVIVKLELFKIKKVGYDFDKVIVKGMIDIF